MISVFHTVPSYGSCQVIRSQELEKELANCKAALAAATSSGATAVDSEDVSTLRSQASCYRLVVIFCLCFVVLRFFLSIISELLASSFKSLPRIATKY
jgi:hypothetical protein